MLEVRGILNHSLVYRLWQAPVARRKVAPFVARVDLATAGRVIDVGCGPGVSASLFPPDRYLGVDVNQRYIAHARRRYPHHFEVCDIAQTKLELGTFDLAFVNSVFHHLSDAQTSALLTGLRRYLPPGAQIHIIDLVLPQNRSVARFLAKWDRGAYARPISAWKELIGREADLNVCESFKVGPRGLPLWHLIYIQGTLREESAPQDE